MPVAVVVFIAVVAVALLVLGLLFLRYHTSPVGRWKAGVRAAVAAHQVRLRRARSELAKIDADPQDRELRNKYIAQQLESVAVEELAKFAGIGPVTVSRLREAGLSTIAACGRARLSAIPGIGPSRESDLRDALKKLWREAESRFDAGASPQATAYFAERKRRVADRDRRRQAAQAEVGRAESALAGLNDRARLAAEITFFGHLMGRAPVGLTPEVIARPLVEVQPQAERAKPAEPEASARATPSITETITPANPESPAAVALADASGSAGPAHSELVKHVEASPLARLRAVAGLGLAIAKADGRIANAERKQVRVFLERRYATDLELAGRLDAVMSEIEADLPTLGDALWNVKQKIPGEAWPELYQFAVSVADAAGERNTKEVECLARIAEELGIGIKPPPAHVPAPVVASQPDAPLTEPECRAALDIAAETPLSVDLIRRQYRLLSERFAPDKFTTHGPDFVKMAADKRVKAERAARHLLAGYNEPLEPPAAPAPPADLRHNPDLDDVFGA
jgi:uncharacterized tellurite resistance protein B-like protein